VLVHEAVVAHLPAVVAPSSGPSDGHERAAVIGAQRQVDHLAAADHQLDGRELSISESLPSGAEVVTPAARHAAASARSCAGAGLDLEHVVEQDRDRLPAVLVAAIAQLPVLVAPQQ
jgi:hypothetical protein